MATRYVVWVPGFGPPGLSRGPPGQPPSALPTKELLSMRFVTTSIVSRPGLRSIRSVPLQVGGVFMELKERYDWVGQSSQKRHDHANRATRLRPSPSAADKAE